ncbi:hypothetical protein WCE37_03425 [Luteimonas sp. MJ250]|uniref:hypothetical protein n=1 Tax=Luteimonas sp. MJ250 TaxID=3129236 RepID=UPI0031BA51BC
MNAMTGGQLVVTPHPVTLEGQRHIPCDLKEGETLAEFLGRHIDLAADTWEAKLGGVVVPAHLWSRVKPKHGAVIEARGAVNKQALYIVAFIALMYFTGGMAAAGGFAGVGGMVTGSAMGAALINAGVFIAGAAIGERASG